MKRITNKSVLEVAILDVRPGMEADFESAFEVAQKIISSMHGYVSHELQRCVEKANRYILLVNWDTLEDHTTGFRGSPQYQEWRSLLHHYYDPFPEVQHYEPVYGSEAATPAGLMKEYEQALASQDWARVEPLLHTDVCVTFASGTFKGKEAVRSAFERNFSLIKDERYAISDLHWVTTQGTVICLYSFSWSGIVRGQPASGEGRGTSAFIKVGQVWQIISEHLGPNAS